MAVYYMANLVTIAIPFMLCKLYPIRDVFYRFCVGMAYATAASTPLTLLLSGSSGSHMGDVSDQLTLFAIIALNDCLGLMAVLYLVWNRSMSKRRAIVLSTSLLAGLYLTFGKTEIIALAVAGMVYTLLAPGTFKRRLMRILLMAAGIGIGWIAVASKIDDYLSSSGSTETLSGRIILWTQTLAQISNGPFIRGFGFYSFQEIGPNPWRNPNGIVHAHNEFLQVWFNLGLVGVALVFGMYFALGFTSLRSLRRKGGFVPTLILAAVVYCLIRGLAEGSPNICTFPIPWLLLFDCLVSTPVSERIGRAIPERIPIGSP
ncbi:MAG: O-antigen ligase family protein [Terracidiphilus sp.]